MEDKNIQSKINVAGLFKRWIILLLVVLALSLIWSGYSYYGAEKYFNNSFGDIDKECKLYLGSVDDDWKSEQDQWYYSNCDPSNQYSDWSIKLNTSSLLRDDADKAFEFTGLVLVLLFLSYLGKWLLTGNIRWQQSETTTSN